MTDATVESLQSQMDTLLHKLSIEWAHLQTQMEEQIKRDVRFDNMSGFDMYEIYENQMDTFIHKYQTIKELMKEGRLVQHYIEQRQEQIKNELRFAKNTLKQYGVDTSIRPES